MVVGFDARETSPGLANAAAQGIRQTGSDVLNIGLAEQRKCTGVSEFKADAGIEVTASHNPIEYNGMKIVKAASQPLTDKEFFSIKSITEENISLTCRDAGLIVDKKNEAREAYLNKITSFVDLEQLSPLKIVLNSGNGCAGPVIDALKQMLAEKGVATNFILVDHKPDGSFPNGVPNSSQRKPLQNCRCCHEGKC